MSAMRPWRHTMTNAHELIEACQGMDRAGVCTLIGAIPANRWNRSFPDKATCYLAPITIHLSDAPDGSTAKSSQAVCLSILIDHPPKKVVPPLFAGTVTAKEIFFLPLSRILEVRYGTG